MKVANHHGQQEVARAFGAMFRAARLKRGMSQEGVAALCCLDRTYPSLLERGLRQPTLGVLIRVAIAFGTKPEQLVADTMTRLQTQPTCEETVTVTRIKPQP